MLGAWYATVLRWRRPAALLVNELTLLPLVVPLAPAKTLLTRFPDALAELLAAHRVPAQLIEAERAQALEHRLAATANRSLVGVMNEFAHLADLDRAEKHDLMRLSMRRATTPCGPLVQRHISPDRELAAFLAEVPARSDNPTATPPPRRPGTPRAWTSSRPGTAGHALPDGSALSA